MSTRVLGYFDTSEAAIKGEILLQHAGFPASDVVLQSSTDKGAANTFHYVESLANGQSLLVVTVMSNDDEEKAIQILRESEAVKIDEVETRAHSGG